jgi:hypothetical protein
LFFVILFLVLPWFLMQPYKFLCTLVESWTVLYSPRYSDIFLQIRTNSEKFLSSDKNIFLIA